MGITRLSVSSPVDPAVGGDSGGRPLPGLGAEVGADQRRRDRNWIYPQHVSGEARRAIYPGIDTEREAKGTGIQVGPYVERRGSTTTTEANMYRKTNEFIN